MFNKENLKELKDLVFDKISKVNRELSYTKSSLNDYKEANDDIDNDYSYEINCEIELIDTYKKDIIKYNKLHTLIENEIENIK